MRQAIQHLLQADDPSDGYFGSLVASRHPIAAADRRDIGGRPGQVVDLDVDGTVVRVVPVHTQAPIFDHDVVVWHYDDGLTFEAIGDRLGISADAARKQWNRALIRLQSILGPAHDPR